MSSPPTGILTFLFTDIAGSTRLWDTQHEAMKLAHARQADLITASVLAHNGHQVRDRGEGDSTFSVFRSPADALAAACDFQRALQAETWPTEVPVRVRAALHLGPAELREGDYNSTAVNRCARLRSLAAPGQTLVSQAVTEAVREDLPKGVTLKPLGSHRLKDLERPEQVFQLCHPDLPDDFAPLRSLDTLPTNLPQQITRFIGREAEIKHLLSLLHPDAPQDNAFPSRLLTLLGTGGAGKTRLALQAGAELLDAYPDGVWLVELATLSEGSLVTQEVATALGLREEPGRTLLVTLQDYLRSRTLLLILDNCEHLVEACARLAETLLLTCAHLHLLATSREPLQIPGETLWRIPSLSLPGESTTFTPETVRASEAVQLFLDRVVSVSTGFEVTPENAGAIAQISRRLDGIPLALELAAARVRVLSVEQIASRLDDRFRLLTSGSRTALPRQQTLRALVDWSYDLLSEPERVLLARLSVFSGGWTLEAAEHVCADAEMKEDVLDLLTSLVDKSLILAEEGEGAVRYRMLETIRQYGAEKLTESEEKAVLRKRHRDWYLTFAEEARSKLGGAEQGYWLEALEREHDNLRQALTFCLEEPGEAVAGLRFAGALQQFWTRRGHFYEGRDRIAALLAHPEAQERTQDRGHALNGAGALAYFQSDYAASRTFHEESLAIRRELGDKLGIARSTNNLGIVALDQGDYALARALYTESLAALRELEDKAGIAAALYNLGLVAYEQGDYSVARSLNEESLAIRRELGDRGGIAMSLNALGRVARDQGDCLAARSLYEESLVLYRELGEKKSVANAFNNLGGVAFGLGDHAQARSLHEESLAIRRELGDKAGIAMSFNNLGNVACSQGDYAQARTLYQESLAIKRELGDKKGAATSLNGLGNVARYQGEYGSARALYQESLGIRRELGDKLGLLDSLEGFAYLFQAAERGIRAAQLWGAAERLREEIGAPMDPDNRAVYDHKVEEARHAAGESAFLAAWSEGRAMPLEQAIGLALEEPAV